MAWINTKKTLDEWLIFECRPRTGMDTAVRRALKRFPDKTEEEIIERYNVLFKNEDVSAKTERELKYYKEQFENTQRRGKLFEVSEPTVPEKALFVL